MGFSIEKDETAMETDRAAFINVCSRSKNTPSCWSESTSNDLMT